MQTFCTYCSRDKTTTASLLPAWQRYQSSRIADIQRQAESMGIPFCILSGEFGLLDWDQPIPWYDHLLVADEVPQLASLVARQLSEKRILQLDYFTQSTKGS